MIVPGRPGYEDRYDDHIWVQPAQQVITWIREQRWGLATNEQSSKSVDCTIFLGPSIDCDRLLNLAIAIAAIAAKW